jgi:signal transduction histidine kinase
MSSLIDDLLNLARITRGEIRRQPVELTRMAQEIVGDLRRAAPERTTNVVIAPGMEVRADPRLTRVVLENLLGNAWKFTGKQADARIEFGVEGRDGMKEFFVWDNGAGFNMDYVDKLFHPFQRLHSQTEFEGSGIGLATVNRIINRHGGRIRVEARPGAGATFWFTMGVDS